MRSSIALLVTFLVLPLELYAQKPREHDLGLPIGGTPGALDAITDVAGVEVGHTTLVTATILAAVPRRTRRRNRDRSSSSWRRTPGSCRISSSASPCE